MVHDDDEDDDDDDDDDGDGVNRVLICRVAELPGAGHLQACVFRRRGSDIAQRGVALPAGPLPLHHDGEVPDGGERHSTAVQLQA